MKRNNLTCGFLILMSSWVWSSPDISMEVARFQKETSGFIEISLYVDGSSLICNDQVNGTYGISSIVWVYDRMENIVLGDRYLLSREGCPAKDIMDVRRFSLPPGQYVIEVEAVDLFDTLNAVTIRQAIEMDAVHPAVALSDLQLLANIVAEPETDSPLHKSGFFMEPLPFRLYYPALRQLYMYHEIYRSDLVPGQPYIKYTLSPLRGDVPAPVTSYKKVKKDHVAANVFQLDISTLISGPYLLEASLYDGDKNLVAASQIEFNRFNPKGDSLFVESGPMKLEFSFVNDIPDDSLGYCMKAMAPIVNSMDVDVMNALLQKGSNRARRFFIHRYWTNQSGKHARTAFEAYMRVARVVDESYRSGFGYGFETDRGHIFLKYGKPDDVIAVEDEPSAPPYEIWFYNSFPATHQNNVRFLFYNPTLATNGHRLLHSTALGEIRNERWEVDLYRDATMETPGVNDKVMGRNVHRNARKYFEN